MEVREHILESKGSVRYRGKRAYLIYNFQKRPIKNENFKENCAFFINITIGSIR